MMGSGELEVGDVSRKDLAWLLVAGEAIRWMLPPPLGVLETSSFFGVTD